MSRGKQVFHGLLLAAVMTAASCLAHGPSVHRLGATVSPNQNSLTLFIYQQLFDGGAYSYGDGGPSSYADGGPYTSSDAGYFCDGGTWFSNPNGCYQLTYDGGPLALDAGPVSYDGGPFVYDAGVLLPLALLDAGATSQVIWTPQYQHISWIGTVSTDAGQDAYGNLAFFATNDGNDFVKLTTPAPIQLNQDGGAGQSSLNYSIDLTPFNDYFGIEVVFSEDGGSNGVLSGYWFVKP